MNNGKEQMLVGRDLLPKYYQVQQWILERITAGEWKVGDEIPSESQLCEEYRVSRGTVRRAVDDLVRQGLLTRMQGKCTFVAKPRIPLFSHGFRADIQNAGQSPQCTILQYRRIPSTRAVASLLETDPALDLYELRRTISAEGEPIIVETVYLPLPYGERLHDHDLLHTSLLDVVQQSCDLILKKAVESYEPTLLRPEEALLLHGKVNDLAILDQAITYDIQDRPVFLSKALIRRDRARIVTEITFQI